MQSPLELQMIMETLMENKLTPELIEKAKQAKSPEELIALAKESEIALSEDEAKAYFERLNRSGALSDEELDSVSGGVMINEREFTAVIYGTNCFNGQFLNNPLCDGKFARDDNHSQRERFRNNAHKPEGAACCAYCLRLAFNGGTAYCELSGR